MFIFKLRAQTPNQDIYYTIVKNLIRLPFTITTVQEKDWEVRKESILAFASGKMTCTTVPSSLPLKG
jgi:hypothetical protein